ncbi:MAG: sulfatase-like hydrolase/transferase [Armatimonadetes bacterium]|nr:sulfatase-like hydrolase/transferase [Armatimonadota bacterium]
MRLVCVLLDTLRRDICPSYGPTIVPDVQTPNLDALDERSAQFQSHYVTCSPCMPARRNLWTGQCEFLWRPWGSLEPWDRPLPRVLKQAGVTTQLITDHYHLFERGGENYHIDFDGWELIRGHENDPWITAPPADIYPEPTVLGHMAARYRRNMETMTSEERYRAPRTFIAAADWLAANRKNDDFFLLIDEFDPHEPFHSPPSYRRLYHDDTPDVAWPPYGRVERFGLTDEVLDRYRAAYASQVTCTDRWLGHLFDTMDRLGMWDDTAVIVMTDHGYFFGDHGWSGKPGCPWYNAIAHIPMWVYLPGEPARQVSQVSQNHDIYATILDWFGVEPAEWSHSRSLLPLARGGTGAVRDLALYGWFGMGVNVTDGRETYLCQSVNEGNTPLAMYSQRWSTAPWWQVPEPDAQCVVQPSLDRPELVWMRRELSVEDQRPLTQSASGGHHPSQLFDLRDDPGQLRPVTDEARIREWRAKLKRRMEEFQAPEEQYARLGL